MSLAPCTSCARHVRTVEISCPFCGAGRVATAPPPPPMAGRLGRAAIMAFGVAGALALGACGDDSSPPRDAGTDSLAMPYGAPPADGVPV